MRRTRFVLSIAIPAVLTCVAVEPATAQTNLPEETPVTTSARTALGITIYNDNRALVRDTRTLELHDGLNRIAFRDVAATMRPETAALKGISGPGFSLIEQNFDFDLLTPAAMLRKYVGKDVSIIHTNPATGNETSEKATVLANNEGVVLRFADRIETGIPGRMVFGDLPANLRDRPTLSMLISAHGEGREQAELMYLAGNVGWKADYVATLGADSRKMNLAGWVTLTNQSGTSYENAKLQLVTGTLNRVRDQAIAGNFAMSSLAKAVRQPEMSEEKLSDYHLYTVERPTTILQNQTKQVALLSAASVPVKREYVIQQPPAYYSWFQSAHPEIQKGIKPGVFLSFENKDGELGKPLPAGTVRFYTQDRSGGMQFVGEDALAHTAKGEKVQLKMGEAFDITADRVQTEYKSLSARSSLSSYHIEVRNADPNPVAVTVREPLQGDWAITVSNLEFVKESSGSAVWILNVPGNGKQSLDYTATVKW